MLPSDVYLLLWSVESLVSHSLVTCVLLPTLLSILHTNVLGLSSFLLNQPKLRTLTYYSKKNQLLCYLISLILVSSLTTTILLLYYCYIIVYCFYVVITALLVLCKLGCYYYTLPDVCYYSHIFCKLNFF